MDVVDEIPEKVSPNTPCCGQAAPANLWLELPQLLDPLLCAGLGPPMAELWQGQRSETSETASLASGFEGVAPLLTRETEQHFVAVAGECP